MSPNLVRRTMVGAALLFALMGSVLAISAGSIAWPQGWMFLATFAACCASLTAYFLVKDAALIERRLSAGPTAEPEPRQKLIQAINSLSFLTLLAVAGLDDRFSWSTATVSSVAAGHVLIVLGFAGIFRVFRENSFASSIIVVDRGQRVIATGPYASVRHPMYAAGFAILVGIPLGLGSWWALLADIPLMFGIIARLLDEEQILNAQLHGYAAYCDTVRWRLVPGVW